MDHKCSIKDFVQDNSLVFKAGRGFYEFTKPETISAKKEAQLFSQEIKEEKRDVTTSHHNND